MVMLVGEDETLSHANAQEERYGHNVACDDCGGDADAEDDGEDVPLERTKSSFGGKGTTKNNSQNQTGASGMKQGRA